MSCETLSNFTSYFNTLSSSEWLCQSLLFFFEPTLSSADSLINELNKPLAHAHYNLNEGDIFLTFWNLPYRQCGCQLVVDSAWYCPEVSPKNRVICTLPLFTQSLPVPGTMLGAEVAGGAVGKKRTLISKNSHLWPEKSCFLNRQLQWNVSPTIEVSELKLRYTNPPLMPVFMSSFI